MAYDFECMLIDRFNALTDRTGIGPFLRTPDYEEFILKSA